MIPRLIFKVGRGYLSRVYFGFSIPILVRTVFAPWRRDIESAANQPLTVQLRVIVDNLVSRVFGAVVRLSTLVIGGLAVIITGLVVGLAWMLWLGLPFLIVLLMGVSWRILIGGRV